MKKVIRNLTVILISLSFSSCDVLDSDDSSLSPLDTKVDFKVIESYDNYETVSTPKIYLELVSEKIYPCFNYGIAAGYKMDGRTIEVNIPGIDKPSICLTAFGPARKRIKLGEISGIYEIKFTGSGFVNKCNMLISDSLIILDGEGTPDTKPLINFAYRYPENSFAYLCGTTFSDTSLCESFIDKLKSVISITEFHFTDIAEIPYPGSSQGYYYDADARFFRYQNESDFDKIEDVMKSFKESNFPTDNGVGLSIINWMNKKIYSWLL